MKVKHAILRNMFISVAVGLASAYAHASATITLNQHTYTFDSAPRLAEVIAPEALKADWYWPASRLFRLQPTATTLTQQQQAIALLTQLANKADADNKWVYETLAQDLATWPLAEKIAIDIDYDAARANPAANPRFEAGAYQLTLERRPDYVWLVGAVKIKTKVPHKAATSVADYAFDTHFTALADQQRLFIIQPNGKVIEAGLQRWNAEHTEVLPGSVIFVPFATGIFSSEIAELNELLLALVVNRIY